MYCTRKHSLPTASLKQMGGKICAITRISIGSSNAANVLMVFQHILALTPLSTSDSGEQRWYVRVNNRLGEG